MSKLIKRARAHRKRAERGYALLLALFLAALVIIATATAVPSLLNESRRQKEEEMIWRGKQYKRAIGLYYRKTGHFPRTTEDLAKGVAGVHFLRQAYKDPMNKQEDGSWRLIYLGPNGELIGSTRFHTLAEYQAVELGPLAGPPGAVAGILPAPVNPAQNPPTSAAEGQEQEQAQAQPQETGEKQPAAATSPAPTTLAEANPLVGGSFVGVGSKVKKPSLKVYLGGSIYNQWEFIWTPVQLAPAGVATPIAVPVRPGQPQLGQPTGTAPMPMPGSMPTPSPSAPPSPTPPPQP